MASGTLRAIRSSSGASATTSRALKERSQRLSSQNGSRFDSKRDDDAPAASEVEKPGIRWSRRRRPWLISFLGRLLVHCCAARQSSGTGLLLLLLGCEAVCAEGRVSRLRPRSPAPDTDRCDGAARRQVHPPDVFTPVLLHPPPSSAGLLQ